MRSAALLIAFPHGHAASRSTRVGESAGDQVHDLSTGEVATRGERLRSCPYRNACTRAVPRSGSSGLDWRRRRAAPWSKVLCSLFALQPGARFPGAKPRCRKGSRRFAAAGRTRRVTSSHVGSCPLPGEQRARSGAGFAAESGAGGAASERWPLSRRALGSSGACLMRWLSSGRRSSPRGPSAFGDSAAKPERRKVADPQARGRCHCGQPQLPGRARFRIVLPQYRAPSPPPTANTSLRAAAGIPSWGS